MSVISFLEKVEKKIEEHGRKKFDKPPKEGWKKYNKRFKVSDDSASFRRRRKKVIKHKKASKRKTIRRKRIVRRRKI